jgi:hypothetical protein
MRRVFPLLVSALFLPALALVATALPANASAPSATAAGVKGTYEFTFVPNNGSGGDSYHWTLKKHHVLSAADGAFGGTWNYYPHKGTFTAKYTSEKEGPATTPICTFTATGSPRPVSAAATTAPLGLPARLRSTRTSRSKSRGGALFST